MAEVSFVVEAELRSIRKSQLQRAAASVGVPFRRDPRNPKDANAIEAVDARRIHVAYVEKELAALLAQHMDNNEIDLFG